MDKHRHHHGEILATVDQLVIGAVLGVAAGAIMRCL
jgi:hypothetical protein